MSVFIVDWIYQDDFLFSLRIVATRNPFFFTFTHTIFCWRYNVPRLTALSLIPITFHLPQALFGYGHVGALDLLYALLIYLGVSLVVAMKNTHGEGRSQLMPAKSNQYK